jgi:hypothetical protein
MTDTKRAYNKDPTIWVKYYTKEDLEKMKYKQVCFGNCSRCKNNKIDQKRRTDKKRLFMDEIMIERFNYEI